MMFQILHLTGYTATDILSCMAKIVMTGYQCDRCGHKWAPKKDVLPKVCPKCKSPYWDTPRQPKKNCQEAPDDKATA